MKTNLTKEDKKKLAKLFPFEYVGGGYFRQKGVPVKSSAPTLHADQAIEYLYNEMKNSIDND